GGRMLWSAVGAAGIAAVPTIAVGLALRVATLDYLVGMSAFLPVVLILLTAAAVGSGADGFARWALMLAWGVLVFPVATIGPLLVTVGCSEPACRFADFAGAIPLFASSSAFVVLAWLPAVTPMDRLVLLRWSAAIGAVLAIWVAFIVWL